MPYVPRELQRRIESEWERYKKTHENWQEYYPGWFLWHGTRKKSSISDLKREGFCYPLTHEAKSQIKSALKYFGKEYLLTHSGRTGERLRQMLWEVTSSHRMKIWASSQGKDSACSWANRSPEIITLALDAAGVDKKIINKYLLDNFGRPLAVKIRHRVPPHMAGPNENLGVRCLESNDIEEIYECPVYLSYTSSYLGPGVRPDGDIEKETGEKIPKKGYVKRKEVL